MQRLIAELQQQYCNKSSDADSERQWNHSSSADSGVDHDLYHFSKDLSLQTFPHDYAGEWNVDAGEWDIDAGVFHRNAVVINQNTLYAYCGKLTLVQRHVKCTPQPDAFK